MTQRLKNILVIGESGVGKSSAVNLILGRHAARASSSTKRAVYSTEKHMYEDVLLIDCMGYNDATETTPTEALKNLTKFAVEIKTQGIALIIYVMKKGRLTASSKTNYDYFVKEFCQNQVPVLLMVTHSEDESEPRNWYVSQKKNFESYEMVFKDAICGCTINLENPNLDPELKPFYARKVEKTQEEIRQKIREVALEIPWVPTDWVEWVVKTFLFQVICLGITAATLIKIGPFLVAFLGEKMLGLIVAAMAKSK